MENNIKSIHDFDFNLICEYYLTLERQGPGSPEITLKALGFIDNLTGKSRIADIGCGTGGQTMVLAQNVQGNVTGIDLFPGFINRFNANAGNLNLQDRVKGIIGSMDNLPCRNEEFDLIWSEGAIDEIGFEKGLTHWHGFLKTNGYVAVTCPSWLTDEHPAEVAKFWTDAGSRLRKRDPIAAHEQVVIFEANRPVRSEADLDAPDHVLHPLELDGDIAVVIRLVQRLDTLEDRHVAVPDYCPAQIIPAARFKPALAGIGAHTAFYVEILRVDVLYIRRENPDGIRRIFVGA